MKLYDQLILKLHGYTSITEIADCYYFGKHVDINIVLAMRLYQQAAARNVTQALFRLSDISVENNNYAHSFFLKAKAYESVEEWKFAFINFKLAADLNHIDAMIYLAKIYNKEIFSVSNFISDENSIISRIDLLRKTTKLGVSSSLDLLHESGKKNPYAFYILGLMYELGEIDKKINSRKALSYYERARKKNILEASVRCAQIFELGTHNISPDLDKSFNIYLDLTFLNANKISHLKRVAYKCENNLYKLSLANYYLLHHLDDYGLRELKKLLDIDYSQATEVIPIWAESYPNLTYKLANLFKLDSTTNNLNVTSNIKYFKFLGEAAKSSHIDAIKILEDYSNERAIPALIALASVYLQNERCSDAIKCYEILAEEGWFFALIRIVEVYENLFLQNPSNSSYMSLLMSACWISCLNNNFKALITIKKLAESSSAACLMVSDLYQNKMIFKGNNTDLIMEYLLKALAFQDVHSIEASYRLAAIYEHGTHGNNVNLDKSCYYYAKFADIDGINATNNLVRILQFFKDFNWYYKLGKIYYDLRDDIDSAIHFFRIAADNGHLLASTTLYQLSENDSDISYRIGELYRYDLSVDSNKGKSYEFYAIAASQNHITSLAILNEKIASNDHEAQYFLGKSYYRQKNYKFEGLDLLIKALNKNNIAAKKFFDVNKLSLQEIVHIARRYELGEHGFVKSTAKAIVFYKKAHALNCKNASFKLGEIYQLAYDCDNNSTEKDYNIIISYFLESARRGRKDAIRKLERLCTDANNEIKFLFACIFRDEPFSDIKNAIKWFELAAEEGNIDAKKQLSFLQKSSQISNNTFFFVKTINASTTGIKSSYANHNSQQLKH